MRRCDDVRGKGCRRRRPFLPLLVLSAAVVPAALPAPALAATDVQVVTQQGGPPILPVPTFQETGLPNFVMPIGSTQPVAPTPDDGTATGTGTGTVPPGSTAADTTLQSRSWGALAAQNAAAMGVNPSVIAAACVMESGCTNVPAAANSRISGAFQMLDSTYAAAMQRAAAESPQLAATMNTGLSGKMDPANEAIAAAQELKTAASVLQRGGISNPTFLDTRGYYQFGAGAGLTVAQASGETNLYNLLSTWYSPAQLARNGVTPSTTVGQWRQTVVTKVGDAANLPVRS